MGSLSDFQKERCKDNKQGYMASHHSTPFELWKLIFNFIDFFFKELKRLRFKGLW